MKWMTSTQPWITAILFGVFIFTVFYIGDYNKPKAAYEHTLPPSLSYQLIGANVLHVPLYSSSEEQSIVKGMVITKASTQAEFTQIAHHIKEQFAGKHIDFIELTIHNQNSGWFEEESVPYEPISKGTISIAYTPLGHNELKMTKHEDILIQLNN